MMKPVHGHTTGKRSPTYNTWRAMIDRCTTRPRYRALGVCSRWQTFDAFLADMGERPAGMTLDRVDNDKGYAPENCRWASKRTQSSNTSRNRRISYDGQTLTITEWADRLGINRALFRLRLRRGWTFEDASQPPIGLGKTGSTKEVSTARRPS